MGKLYPVEQVREAIALIDEVNERKPSRVLYGIEQTLHAKLCTVRATLARSLVAHRIEATPAVDREGVRTILWNHLGGDDRYIAINTALDAIMALPPAKQSLTPEDAAYRSELCAIVNRNEGRAPAELAEVPVGTLRAALMMVNRFDGGTVFDRIREIASDDRTIEHSSIVAERVRDGLEQIATASEDTEASVLRYIAKATLDAITAGNSLLEGSALGLAERAREACAREAEAWGGTYPHGPVHSTRTSIASAIRSLDITRMDSDG